MQQKIIYQKGPVIIDGIELKGYKAIQECENCLKIYNKIRSANIEFLHRNGTTEFLCQECYDKYQAILNVLTGSVI